MHLSTKFQHPVFNRSEVIVLTNKRTNNVEKIYVAPLCHAGGEKIYWL